MPQRHVVSDKKIYIFCCWTRIMFFSTKASSNIYIDDKMFDCLVNDREVNLKKRKLLNKWLLSSINVKNCLIDCMIEWERNKKNVFSQKVIMTRRIFGVIIYFFLDVIYSNTFSITNLFSLHKYILGKWKKPLLNLWWYILI